jgi:purine-binding chemotaxis protein CheW
MNTTTATAETSERMGLGEQQQYLTFMSGGETYAIGILRIKEIIQNGQLTAVPQMPESILGVINLRGAVVPVIDLSARFGKKSTPVGKRNCIIIIDVASGAQTNNVGVMVDAVNAVLDIPATEIEPPPSFSEGIRADFIDGMGKIDSKFVIILNVQQVLAMDSGQAAQFATLLNAVEPVVEDGLAVAACA